MRGHEAIIAMRRQRLAPEVVVVEDVGADVNWHKYSDATPNVEILETERVEQLDLRWSVGLNLHLSFLGENRANQVMNAFLKYKPKRVICCAFEKKFNAHGLPAPELIETIDTDGVMTWHR